MNTATAEAPAETATDNPNVDAFGTEIKEGCTLAFATRKQSSMWLSKLKITEVRDTHIRGYDPEDVRRRYKTLTNRSTTVVLSGPEASN